MIFFVCKKGYLFVFWLLEINASSHYLWDHILQNFQFILIKAQTKPNYSAEISVNPRFRLR